MGKGRELEAIVKITGELAPSVSKSLKGLEKKLGGVNKKALVVGASVATISIATVKAVATAGKKMVELGTKFDSAYDKIRIGTGATGKALDGLKNDFEKVYSSVPTTMEDASQAVADYNTRLGLSGDTLQNMSKQAIQVSDMLGEDLNSVIEQSSKAFQQWGVSAEDMNGAMDYTFKVSQSTGLGFGDLMSKMQQFGPQLQDMGLSFNEASAMIGQLDKAGVNTNEVLGAMKKSVVTLAKEGKSASEGIQEYYEKIKNAGSAAEAASIASEIFGARAGSTMASAIRKGTISAEELTASLEKNGETIAGAANDTYDFSERLQTMKQSLEVAFAPVANTIFDRMNDFMPILQNLMETLIPVIDKAVQSAMPFVDNFLNGAVKLFNELLPLIEQLSSTLMPILTDLMSNLLPPILELIHTIIPPLMEIMSVILPPIAQVIGTIATLLGRIITAILPPLKSLLDVILPLIKPILGILQPIASVLDTIANIIGRIVSFGSGVLSKVIGLFGGGGGKGASLPAFAKGGFTDGVSIAGEAGTEAVISFNPAYRKENLSYWAQAGRMLGATTADFSLTGSSGRTTSVNLGGVSFSPTIYGGGGNGTDIVEQLRREYPEFLDLLKDALRQEEDLVYA